MSQNQPASAPQARTVTAVDRGTLDVRSLVLFAVLLAAGLILNMTVSKMLSGATGGTLAPEFIIAAFCLEILIVRPKVAQSLVIGLIAGVIILISASVKGPDLIAEPLAAAAMTLIVNAFMKGGLKPFVPAIGTFVTTVISGLVYAVIVACAINSTPSLILVMAPVIAISGVANAVIVSVLYIPVKAALKLED